MHRIEWAMNRLYKPERPIPRALFKLVLDLCMEGGDAMMPGSQLGPDLEPVGVGKNASDRSRREAPPETRTPDAVQATGRRR